jgi:hypothetical protein
MREVDSLCSPLLLACCAKQAKFIVRPDGTVAGRYTPHTSPNALRPIIDQILADAEENVAEL